MSRFFLHISIINDNKLIQIGNQTQTTALKPDTPGGSPVHRTFHPRLQSSSMTDIKVGAPEFSVSVSGKTSYSYYTSQGAEVANTKIAETIYEVSSNITIADNILGNSNYSKPAVTYTVDDKTVSGTYSASKTHNQGEISGLSWNSHTLKATVTFDGKESVGECPCVITGLPYSTSFSSNNKSGWSTSGSCSWEDTYIRLGNWTSGEASVSRNDFYIPESINVYISARFDAHRATVGTKFKIELSGTEVISEEGNKYMSTSSYTKNNVEAIMKNGSVKCINTYSSGETHSKLYSISLIYR